MRSRDAATGSSDDRSSRWPLLIDPQGQANRFIRQLGKDKNLDVVKLTEKNFLRSLENGVQLGRWVLLENVGETLDAARDYVPESLQGEAVLTVGAAVHHWRAGEIDAVVKGIHRSIR